MQETLEIMGPWKIIKAKDDHIFVVSEPKNGKASHEDHPLLVAYPDGTSTVLWDFPERIPACVKARVKKLLMA